PPLSRDGKFALIVFATAFVAMFVILVFPDSCDSLLNSIGSRFRVPEPPKDMQGKSLPIRSLYATSLLAVPFMLSFFPLYAAMRRVKVYEQFVEGAKEAFNVALRIIP